MRTYAALGLSALLSVSAVACGGASPPPARVVAPPRAAAARDVFERVVPSVVAILNDIQDEREAEATRTLKEMGVEGHAPKRVIDVSLRKEPMPHGTGFMIAGGLVLTAAHVVLDPTRLKITTRAGKTVDAEVVAIDEVRDVAVLRPKTPLPEVPPLGLYDGAPPIGHHVWALGHTGAGLWALSWGITEGVASGVVDMLDAKLVLHDASVYPGFSGGPVVMLDGAGVPKVIGINHAILFTGGDERVASISSASSVPDIREVLAGHPPPIQKVLADYAKAEGGKAHAELFITKGLDVYRSPQMLTTATIYGNSRVIDASGDASVPIVGMMFGLGSGDHDVTFKVNDPDGHEVCDLTRTLTVPPRERVGFVSGELHFWAKESGRYEVHAYAGGETPVGHTDVWVEDPNSDDDSVNDADTDDVEGGDPKVSVVVAQAGQEPPLTLLGIRAGWAEWSFPRRVAFTWFARGSRGWTGTNVALSSFVLDSKGVIVGRGVGCIHPELRPELPWTCMGAGDTPLLPDAGRYDVVFTLNDRPVAVWPMEAIVRADGQNGALEQWMQALKKGGGVKHDHGAAHHEGPSEPAPSAGHGAHAGKKSGTKKP